MTPAAPAYALWLKPVGPAYDVLLRTIGDLARELNVTPFEPHVTLLADFAGTEADHRRRVSELAAQLQPRRVDLTSASYFDEHFRCLFLLVDPAPHVLAYHAAAARLFATSGSGYLPHVSLIYGSLPELQKQQIIAALPADVFDSFDVEGVVLLRADSPDPKDWHEIATVPFTGSGGRL